ncbi:hypothetical protein [Paenibacillus paeoniae]|nr:hypothetical protein [Paenibacillus paeoniae]
MIQLSKPQMEMALAFMKLTVAFLVDFNALFSLTGCSGLLQVGFNALFT